MANGLTRARDTLFGEDADPNAGAKLAEEQLHDRYAGMAPPTGLGYSDGEKRDMMYGPGARLRSLGNSGYTSTSSPYRDLVGRTDPTGRRALTDLMGTADKLANGELPNDLEFRRQLAQSRALNTANALGATRTMARAGTATGGADALAARLSQRQQATGDYQTGLARAAQVTEARDAGAKALGTIGGAVRSMDANEAMTEAEGQDDYRSWYAGENATAAADRFTRENEVSKNNASRAGDIMNNRIEAEGGDWGNRLALADARTGQDVFRAGVRRAIQTPGERGAFDYIGDTVNLAKGATKLFSGGGK